MGMFSAIFGSAGSDKADKMRQSAIDAFNAIKTPELADLQVQLDKYVQAGQLTPEEAETQLLSSNAFNDIVSDPSLEGAQKQALQSLQSVASQGGLTATDKARMQDITNGQNQEARGRNEAILSQAKERGMGGSDVSTVNQLLNEQGAADRASQRGTDVAAQAEARALQAMQASGDTASKIREQGYGEQAQKAQAANAIDLFNKQTLNQTNLYNVDAANKAAAANLANAQSIANANTTTANQEKTSNASANQTVFQDELAKASGKAGVFDQWANDANTANRAEKGADMALLSGAIGTGATALGTAFGGPVGGAVANGAVQNIGGGNTTNKKLTDESMLPGYSGGGKVAGCGYCNGGMCMEHGGKVPGKPNVPHNSPANDTIKAKLSPGEVVVPLDAQNDDAEFDAFMEKFRPSKANKASPNTHIPLEAQAMANLHKRISDLEAR